MSPELEALRQNKSAFTAVVAAALGFALFCLAGAAILMGWIGPGIRRAAAPTQANEMGLSPGETVVSPADAPAPPPKVEAAPPAISTAPSPSATPSSTKASEPKRPRKPHYATQRPAPTDSARLESPRPRSQSPDAAQAAPHPTDSGDRWPQPACGSCGVVDAVRVFPDLWEVRVRFDDGGHRTLRYSRPQHWHVGDRIRYEGGHLVPE